MKRRITLLLVCLVAWLSTAQAQEYQPYPAPRITPEQWQHYLEIVQANHGESLEIYKDKHLVGFSDQATRTFYIFTTKDHPAHPAWITRQVVEENGQVNVRQIGFFAGAEEPFAKLFNEYLQRNEQLLKSVERRNQ